MKKNLIYCVSAAILAMVFLLAGQANAQTDCTVDLTGDQPTIQCGASDNVIELFAEEVADDGVLGQILFVDIGDGMGPVKIAPLRGLDITIRTGDGSDDVSVHDLSEPDVNLYVETGRGPDKVSVGPNVSTYGLLGIDTGQGGDTVFLGLNVFSQFEVQVFTRGGSDLVKTFAADEMGFQGIAAGHDVIIRGGAGPGIDAIVIGDSSLSAGNRVRLSGFETFGRPELPGTN